ncbi:hypothetical protein AG1IA_06228 [Rhizoctonia solani AG-1 IA]|uniref:Uncharacterized protein n=1 Tax=Thanatephorus cucumeris (strain AG1-IA) TaxID=983506 RepID=L8WSI7_THACA|nr:hypothetical protein AG1IA_06228 [Rhizoctonia solani AG-1 IA]
MQMEFLRRAEGRVLAYSMPTRCSSKQSEAGHDRRWNGKRLMYRRRQTRADWMVGSWDQ